MPDADSKLPEILYWLVWHSQHVSVVWQCCLQISQVVEFRSSWIFFFNCRKVHVRSWELRVNSSHLEKQLEKMKFSLDNEVYSSWPFLLILSSKFLILWHDRREELRP